MTIKSQHLRRGRTELAVASAALPLSSNVPTAPNGICTDTAMETESRIVHAGLMGTTSNQVILNAGGRIAYGRRTPMIDQARRQSLTELLADQEIRQPLVRIDGESRTIDIVDEHQKFRTWDRPYYIDFDRIKTPEAVLAWICHLSEKTWWTSRHARELIWAWQHVTGKAAHFDA